MQLLLYCVFIGAFFSLNFVGCGCNHGYKWRPTWSSTQLRPTANKIMVLLEVECAAKKTKPPNIQAGMSQVLSQLFKNNAKSPIVVFLDSQLPKLRAADSDERDDDDDDDDDEDDDDFNLRTSDYDLYLRTNQNDERAYILYHLLRSTLEEDDVEPSVAENLEYTKELLRQGFRRRCKRLDSCIKKCPEKPSCPKKCKEVYDDLDACGEPKNNCNKPKCGKTMPPYWLLK